MLNHVVVVKEGVWEIEFDFGSDHSTAMCFADLARNKLVVEDDYPTRVWIRIEKVEDPEPVVEETEDDFEPLL